MVVLDEHIQEHVDTLNDSLFYAAVASVDELSQRGTTKFVKKFSKVCFGMMHEDLLKHAPSSMLAGG